VAWGKAKFPGIVSHCFAKSKNN